MSEVRPTLDPYFDLAPRRKRPLSLWNPLDYLVLSYWMLVFPHALGWYTRRFTRKLFRPSQRWKERLSLIRADPVLRGLVLQAGLLMLATPYLIGLGLAATGLVTDWTLAIWSIAMSIICGVAVALYLAGALGIVGVAGGMATSVALGGIFSILLGIGCGIAFSESRGLAVAVGGGILIGAGNFLGWCFGMLRPFDWVLGLPAFPFFLPTWSRSTWLPVPGLRRRLIRLLEQDWQAGVAAADQLLQYASQFLTAVQAFERALAIQRPDDLVARLALMAERLWDPGLLRYLSAPIAPSMLKAAVHGTFFVPERWKRDWIARLDVKLRPDTPARFASAGFWLLCQGEPGPAAEAFAKIRELPHGRELELISRALAAAREVRRQPDFAAWREATRPLEELPAEPLRPATRAALTELRKAAAEVEAAGNAFAASNRSAAIGRAAATLQRLSRAEDLPAPEGVLLREIAGNWLPLVIELGGQVGEALIREPIANPYLGYSGLPVEGPSFVGRSDVLRRLERLWTGAHEWTAIFLYGHRRMGKTSVLRNLQKSLRPGTLVVQLDMQAAAYVDHGGQLMYEFARAIYKRASEAKLDAGERPAPEAFASPGQGRIQLDALLERLEPQMEGRILVLAIDEFEVVQERIEQGKVGPDFLTYLRAINQRHRYLALIFAGLHQLEEMGHHYRTAFFGQAEHVRVDYLKKDDALRLITQPSADFALEHAPDLCEELYRRTFGQPYLLQRLCWELVDAWNDRFLALGEKTPRQLELKDLARLDEEAFFQSTHYYFDGVWSNRTAEEQALLSRLAASSAALPRAEFAAKGELGVVESLERHDVVLEREGGIDFAAALLRDWVAQRHPGLPN